MRALYRANERPVGAVAQREIPSAAEVRPAWKSRDDAGQRHRKAAATRFAALAVASAAMYIIFFASIDRLFPVLTSGTVAGAAIVIALALAFCLVYGSCANYLLELLGIRARK